MLIPCVGVLCLGLLSFFSVFSASDFFTLINLRLRAGKRWRKQKCKKSRQERKKSWKARNVKQIARNVKVKWQESNLDRSMLANVAFERLQHPLLATQTQVLDSKINFNINIYCSCIDSGKQRLSPGIRSIAVTDYYQIPRRFAVNRISKG